MKINFFISKKVYLSMFCILLIAIIASIFYIYPSFSEKDTASPSSKNQPKSTPSAQNQKPPQPQSSSSSKPSNGANVTKASQSAASNSDKMTIVMIPNIPFMYVNNITMEIDPPGRGTAPVIERGRTLIPIAALVSVLGGDTSWNANTKRITINLNGNVIEMGINSRNIVANGKNKLIDVPPKIFNGRTLVPVRFVIDNCDMDIKWTNDKKILIVADYLPEGMKRAKDLFDSTSEIENFSKLPSVINTLTRFY